MQDRSGTARWKRDALGRVVEKVQVLVSGLSQTVGYSYNAQGLLDTLTYPGGQQLKHLYDVTGRLTGLNWNGAPLVTNIVWSALGQPNSWTWAFATPVAATRTFNSAGRMTSTEFSSYGYDAAGRMTGMSQLLGSPADSDSQSSAIAFSTVPFSVTYDAVGRITGFAGAGVSSTFSYDANGNRTTTSKVELGVTTSRSYAADSGSNRHLSMTATISTDAGTVANITNASTFDANGNLVSDGVRHFTYDPEGRLSASSSSSNAVTRYSHNAFGQRVFKTEPLYAPPAADTSDQGMWDAFVAFLSQLWSPQTQVAEQLGWGYVYDEDGTLIAEQGTGGLESTGSRQHVWLPTPTGPMPIATIINGDRFAVHADHLNTPRKLTNEQGQAVWQWKYDAFGEEPPTTAANRFVDPQTRPDAGTPSIVDLTYNLRYPGQYADVESKLNYNYYRSYDPAGGRYTQRDPLGIDGGWNGFVYVEGNPLSFIDPLGLASDGPDGAKGKYQKPENPNKKPPPPHRQKSGERERNVGHENAEEHSRQSKGQRGTRGSRGARGVGGLFIWDLWHEMCEENPLLPGCEMLLKEPDPCPS